MALLLDDPELLKLEDQQAFNLAVWERVLEDEELGDVPHRIETDEFGQIIMSPPAGHPHGRKQIRIGAILNQLLPVGEAISECPLSTRKGVKAVDVAWISAVRLKPQEHQACLTDAPEICVEIISPSNSRRALREKKRLYFEAGAEEVWFRERDGCMVFYLKSAPDAPVEKSALCPNFPATVE